jgi:ferredoxin
MSLPWTAGKLMINPVDCVGHGACAELLPEAITLDEWGYPFIAPGLLPASLARPARQAISACPALALRLIQSD